MKVETNKLICIRKNVEYLGTNVSIKFPQTHTVTGCDTTSFLSNIGENVLTSFKKVSQWKRKAEVSKHNLCFMQYFRHDS